MTKDYRFPWLPTRPGKPAAELRDVLGTTAGEGNPLEPAIRDAALPFTIRREDRPRPPFRARNRRGLGSVQRPQEELCACGGCRNVHENREPSGEIATAMPVPTARLWPEGRGMAKVADFSSGCGLGRNVSHPP